MAVMKETREDRLAAKLRENLRRRKDQAREQKAAPGGSGESPDLSKAPPPR
jgi:tRNA A37 threonylcarbamoyladenosine dehydratase